MRSSKRYLCAAWPTFATKTTFQILEKQWSRREKSNLIFKNTMDPPKFINEEQYKFEGAEGKYCATMIIECREFQRYSTTSAGTIKTYNI